MELPSHPSHPEADDTAHDQAPATGVSWGTMLVIAVVAVLFAAMVILHLTGVVGPAAP
jgi:hypothetical protein